MERSPSTIHNQQGYRQVREHLARQYDLSVREPDIQIVRVDVEGDRSMTLRHTLTDGKPLSQDTFEVLKHLHFLWGFDIHLESWDQDQMLKRMSCPSISVEL